MTADTLWCPTRIVAGRGAADALLRDLPGGDRALVVADAALEARVDRFRPRDVLLVTGADLATVGRVVDRLRSAEPPVIVAFGGGSVIDAVKIAAAAGAGGLTGLTRSIDRGGVRTRRPLRVGAPMVVAVPTTIGTASEVSPVACVTTPTGHRLVVGDDLRPSVAVLDPDELETLPERMVAEGALEAFLRVAGAAASGSLSARMQDEAVDLGRRILDAGDSAVLDGAPAARGRLALLSAETRYSWTAHPRDPFALRHWYPANELAYAASLGKIAATLVVLPRLWCLLLQGDRRLGSAEALQHFWRAVRPQSRLSADEDVLALAVRWRVPAPPAPDAAVLRRAADATLDTWTGPRSALAGWDRRLVGAVLGEEPASGQDPAERRADVGRAHARPLPETAEVRR